MSGERGSVSVVADSAASMREGLRGRVPEAAERYARDAKSAGRLAR